LLINNAIAKSHTHLQFVKANTRAKIAKEYAFVTVINRTQKKAQTANKSS